jgi:hypothetical protein
MRAGSLQRASTLRATASAADRVGGGNTAAHALPVVAGASAAGTAQQNSRVRHLGKHVMQVSQRVGWQVTAVHANPQVGVHVGPQVPLQVGAHVSHCVGQVAQVGVHVSHCVWHVLHVTQVSQRVRHVSQVRRHVGARVGHSSKSQVFASMQVRPRQIVIWHVSGQDTQVTNVGHSPHVGPGHSASQVPGPGIMPPAGPSRTSRSNSSTGRAVRVRV